MAPHNWAAQLADEFVESYPKTLPARIEWLADSLRIDRARLLRLMGLTPEEIEVNLERPWEVIAERYEYQTRWAVELLAAFLARFRYDWKVLADRLHQRAAAAANSQGDRAAPSAGHPAQLCNLPPADREKVLLTLIAEGGPDALTWLFEYLSQATPTERSCPPLERARTPCTMPSVQQPRSIE